VRSCGEGRFELAFVVTSTKITPKFFGPRITLIFGPLKSERIYNFRNQKISPILQVRMSAITSPIHRICPHPSSSILYLASSKSVHKYNLPASSIDQTYTSPNPSGVPQLLEASAEWLFVTGGDKILRVLNAHTLETVAELYFLFYVLINI